jgi:23S rRNA (cytosine1962-C5)-methyltransferase
MNIDSTPTADVFLKPKRAQPFYAQHPWVFAGAIDKLSVQPPDGSVVTLRSASGQFIAHGFYNSQSKIQVRLFTWNEGELLDRGFFQRRLAQAIALRHDVLKKPSGPDRAYRVVFSEADKLPGLVVDRFGNWLTAQFTSLALAQRKEMIGELLMHLLPVRGVYLKNERGLNKVEGLTLTDGVLVGEPPPPELVIREGELNFAVNLVEGQKTGYYLDQCDNHLAVAKFASGQRVLDAFCYGAGFGIHASAAGATEVDCVDGSDGALTLAKRNAELNNLSNLHFHKADVFDHLDQLVNRSEAYGMVVLDPPKFARDRHSLPQAMRGYRRLIQQSIKLLPQGGTLVMCCCTGLISFEMIEELLGQCATEAKREMQLLEKRGPSADHPVSLACREGAYLKCLICRVGPAREPV